MQPIDSARADTPSTPFDELVRSAFAVDLPAALVPAMDEDIARIVRAGSSRVASERRWGRRTTIGLLAAAILVTAGAGSLLLQPFEAVSGPAFDVAWERGDVLDLAQVIDGYEVTLVRGYADAGQVILAVEVEDLEQRRGTSEVASFGGQLVDEHGHLYPGSIAMTGPVRAHHAAVISYYELPDPADPPVGRTRFTLTFDSIGVHDGRNDGTNPWRDVAGPWVFDLELTFAGGGVADVEGVTDTVGGITIHLESFVVTPTTVRAGIRIEPRAEHLETSVLETVFQRGDTTIPMSMEHMLDHGRRTLVGTEGVDDPSGTWTVTIGQLFTTEGRPVGPWTLEVEVP